MRPWGERAIDSRTTREIRSLAVRRMDVPKEPYLYPLKPGVVEMETLLMLDWRSLVLLGIVIFVLRPVAIQLSAIGSNLTRNERLFLSWIAPRGIVAAAVTAEGVAPAGGRHSGLRRHPGRVCSGSATGSQGMRVDR